MMETHTKVATPRILYLTEFWPHRTTIGAELRSLHVLRALEQLGTVEVVVLDETGTGNDQVPTSPGKFKVAPPVKLKNRSTRGLIGKLNWMLNPRIHYPHGCGVDEDGTRRILSSIKDFDLVWFFKWRTPNMFPYAPWPRSVLDIDDVPSTYERTTLQREPSFGKRFLAHSRVWIWKRREKVLGERFTVLTVCSEGDRQYLKALGVKAPMHLIPNGFEKPNPEPLRKPAKPPRIGFIGLFDYFPNREGVQWFVNECWPRIKRVVPDARLRLIGRGSDDYFKDAGQDIDALGWVADSTSEIATWSTMVVPVRAGGGTRVKIAEGFSRKCPIVSTSLGAFGYDVRDGEELLLADDAETFADVCVRTIRQPAESKEMAERAWGQFLKQWTWEAIAPRIRAAAEDCLRLGGRR